jgi:hypothetical protein
MIGYIKANSEKIIKFIKLIPIIVFPPMLYIIYIFNDYNNQQPCLERNGFKDVLKNNENPIVNMDFLRDYLIIIKCKKETDDMMLLLQYCYICTFIISILLFIRVAYGFIMIYKLIKELINELKSNKDK